MKQGNEFQNIYFTDGQQTLFNQNSVSLNIKSGRSSSQVKTLSGTGHTVTNPGTGFG